MPDEMTPESPEQQNPFDDKKLLDLFKKKKQEAFENRYRLEREWLRAIYYYLGRQWITWHSGQRRWIHRRLAPNTPQPVTNKCKTAVDSLCSEFSTVDIGVTARPVGQSQENVAAAEVVDKIAPMIRAEHEMKAVLAAADWWQIVTGVVALQMSWDRDKRFNRQFVQHQQCLVCGTASSQMDVHQNQLRCPNCSATTFTNALDEMGKPMGDWVGVGRGKTEVLSPFEFAVPPGVQKFEDQTYLIRVRWRPKDYYEANYPELVESLNFQKTSTERSLQIYKSLERISGTGSTGISAIYGDGESPSDGVTEYEYWQRPSTEYPQGLVFRVVGDQNPRILHSAAEQLPGPIPYTDVQGQPVWPFAASIFYKAGPRFYGQGLLEPAISKQNQINQLESLIESIARRSASPVWLVPRGSVAIDRFTGDAGQVVVYNPLSAGATTGDNKPERVRGESIPVSLFQLLEKWTQDFDELTGVNDPLKGEKPKGIEAFSGLQLLVERQQSRFTAPFASRSEMYRAWYSFAIEMERQFGPDQRVQQLVEKNGSYTQEIFHRAQLQGAVEMVIEDGSNVPKTALGKRAAFEQAMQGGLLDPANPAQRYKALEILGMTELDPDTDPHVKKAQQIQWQFEQWALAGAPGLTDPMTGQMNIAASPLVYKPWYNPLVHRAQRMDWLNTDRMAGILQSNPQLEEVIALHLQELDFTIQQVEAQAAGAAPPPGPPEPGHGPGGGQSMASSEENTGNPKQSGGSPGA